MNVSYDNSLLQIFAVVTFFIVPIRVYINGRQDKHELPFFIGQFVYASLWFSNWMLGMMLVFQIQMLGNYNELFYIIFVYGFVTAMANMMMLFLQKRRIADAQRNAQNSVNKTASKFYKAKQGMKHIK